MLRGMESIGIDEARKDLGGIVDRARLKNEPTLITRKGKPAAVVISVELAEELRSATVCTADGARLARVLRELREAADGAPPDRPDAPQVPQGEEAGALCEVTEPPVVFHGK